MRDYFSKGVMLFSRETIVLLLFMAAAAGALNIFMQTRSLEEGSGEFGFAKMLDGTAHRPYVFRRLVPITVNAMAELIPAADQAKFVAYHLDRFHLRDTYFGRARFANGPGESWTPEYSLKYHLAYLLMFGSLFASLYLLRGIAAHYLPSAPWVHIAGPAFFALLLPLSFMHGGFYYDFVELLFLAALWCALAYDAAWLWVLLLPLAVANKETAILAPIFLAPLIHQRLRSIVIVCVASLLALAAFFYVRTTFASNPGSGVMFQLQDNLSFWSHPTSYFLWHDFIAPLVPFPRGVNILAIAAIGTLIALGWKQAPTRVRYTFVLSAILSIPLWMFFGYRDEIRNLSLMFMPAYLLACIGAVGYFAERSLDAKEAADMSAGEPRIKGARPELGPKFASVSTPSDT